MEDWGGDLVSDLKKLKEMKLEKTRLVSHFSAIEGIVHPKMKNKSNPHNASVCDLQNTRIIHTNTADESRVCGEDKYSNYTCFIPCLHWGN